MVSANGKRAEIGIGAASAVSLAVARGLAAAMREAAALGHDPRFALSRETPPPEASVPTFGAFAESYIADVEAGWKNAVHRQQWRNSLRDHAAVLTDCLVNEIGTDEVLAVLRPIWLIKPETAQRVRGRIERILAAAKARNLRSHDAINPATWRGHLSVLLPAQPKLTRGHHPALPWAEAPGFFLELQERDAVAARCLEFVILTAARSGEALGATWAEIDLEARVWTVPAGRMKASVEHVVPLSEAAIAMLRTLLPRDVDPAAPVFAVKGATRSNMAMAMLLRRMGRSDITVHGFRSTFRDWAGEVTSYPPDVVEHALAHTVGNKTERAYRRGSAFEHRRKLMSTWSDFLVGRQKETDVLVVNGRE